MTDSFDLITIKQLPIIEEQLRRVREDIERMIADALSMECTEETYKAVKAARASLTKQANEWESRRKSVKAQIMSPYDAFEASYKENIIAPFKAADAELKARITTIEDGLKEQKCEEVQMYFYELMDALAIPRNIISFGRAGIRITLSASVSNLKQQCSDKLGQVSADMEAISKCDDSAEILAEYVKHYNLAKAQTDVRQRHESIEKARDAERQSTLDRIEKQRRALEVQSAAEAASAERSNSLAAPVDDAPIDDTVMTVSFRVTAPKSKLKAMKQFMTDNGIEFESLRKIEIDGGIYYGIKH